MSLSELVRIVGDLAEVLVTVLLAYVVYRIAGLVSTLNHKIKEEKQ
jgi:hypothetical protein